MTPRGPAKPAREVQDKPQSGAAQDRLAQALRENLKRRKLQERAREAAAAPKEDR